MPHPLGTAPHTSPTASCARDDSDPPGHGAAKGLRPSALARAQDFIDHHLAERIGLADIANAACVSRYHFARMFRLSTGRSPMQYLLLRRIERAQQLLSSGRHSVSTVAYELGFFDQSHFVNSFRRVTGATPGRFARHSRAVAAQAGAGFPPRHAGADAGNEAARQAGP